MYINFNSAISYYSDNLIKHFINNKSIYILISSGLARYLQSLDVSVTFPFKNYLKNEF